MAPNFLIIQCDDLGVDDLGWNNPLVHTPNIDALAGESVRFSDFTVNPVCAPSRATFLTGRHFLRTGVSHVHGGKDFLHRDERTLADHFRAAGYATGMWGKWHSGHTEGYFPWQRGFSEAWMAQLYRHREARGLFNGKEVETKNWADVVMADYAIDFIRRHRDRPFFAYLPTMTPHGPFDAPEEWVAFYRKRGHSESLSRLWGMVSALDLQIGRILRELDELDLRGRTVVVFMSDNGPAIEARSLNDADREKRRVSGLRGWKGDLYEGGVRSPLFVNWPGHLEPREVGAPTHSVDLAPTLMAMADIDPVCDAPPMEGRSFCDALLEGNSPSATPVTANYAHRGWLTSGPPYSLDGLPGEYAPMASQDKKGLKMETQSLSIRRGPFKLMLNPDFLEVGGDGSRILVDLANDPGEERNVAGQHPALVSELERELRAWWTGIQAAPHSFSAPCFSLRAGKNQLPARIPSRVRGSVFNQVMELKGWEQPGDGVTYAMRIDSPSAASIRLRWARDQSPANARWTMRVLETGASAATDGTTPVQLILPAGEFHIELALDKLGRAEEIPPLRALEIAIGEVQ